MTTQADRETIDCSITVVIPCYNERDNIKRIVDRVRQVPMRDLEIIVVDNDSTDGTKDVLRTDIEPIVSKVLYNEKNIGKSGSVKRGFAAATRDLVVVQDADLEYDPLESLPLLVAPIIAGEADVVFGSRFLKRGGATGAAANYVANHVLTALSNAMTGLHLTDMETCYKCFRREVIQSITLVEGGFGFEPEVTAKVAKGGWRVVEVPVNYHPRSKAEGKKVRFADGFHSLRCIWKYSR